MEKITIKGTEVRIILIKNTVGCNQVINFLSNIEGRAVLALCLNDRIADGTDISWIQDANFERLASMEDRLVAVYVSGTRADDMELRLKSTGLPSDKIKIIRDYAELIEEALESGEPVYIMPTYTAMLGLRDKLRKTYGLGNFWE